MLYGRRHKNPIQLPDKGVQEWRYATCGYCSTGCAMEVGLDASGRPVTTRGVADAPVNRGKLCIKGITEAAVFDAAGRGTEPLLRRRSFEPWQTCTWDGALDHSAAEFQRIQQRYGRDAVAVVSTGQLLTEEFYTLGKLVRGVIGTNNYDGNTTLCMASAVSGYKRSFGADGPPGCYDDFDHTECLLAFGSNLPEQHPVIYWRLKEALERRRFPVIVVDPRVTMFAQFADLHLPITPGTDLVLLNALAHVILDEGLEDRAYIERHCSGFEALQELVQAYDPVSAARICGIDEDTIRHVARVYAGAGAAMSIWTMGINQSTHGSDGVVRHQQPQPDHRQHRQARRHQPVHHRPVQRHGHPRVVVLFRPARLPPAGESHAPGGDRRLLGRGSGVLPGAPRAVPDRHLSRHRDRTDQGAVDRRDQPADLHAQHPAHPQDPGKTGVPGGAGRLPRRRDDAVCPLLPARGGVGGEGGLLHQHRAARQPGDAGHAAPGQRQSRPVDLQPDGAALAAGPRHGVSRSRPRPCSRR